MDDYLATDRKDFEKGTLTIEGTPNEPFSLFEEWLKDAIRIEETEAYTMVLSTISGRAPRNRVLFLRGFRDNKFIFYSNYKSAKGNDIEGNKNVAINFYWSKLERQLRIQGTIEKCGKQESDTYFAGRPRESQVGAWASNQSSILSSQEELIKKVTELTEKFKGKEVPRPGYWGGYQVTANEMEFWQGGKNRLHDRIAYGLHNSEWIKRRLFP